MTIEFKKNHIICKEVVSVEEAEALLEWLQKKSSAKVDFSTCTHIHPANLQVLMAEKVSILAWPTNPEFATWLQSALLEH